MTEQTTKTNRNWYAVHTYAGYEDAVSRYLKQRIESLAMTDKIFNVVVPKETKIKVRSGRRQISKEKIYPGYVLVDMILDNDSWYVVRNTPRVTGFVGASSAKPTPLSKEEANGRERADFQNRPEGQRSRENCRRSFQRPRRESGRNRPRAGEDKGACPGFRP